MQRNSFTCVQRLIEKSLHRLLSLKWFLKSRCTHVKESRCICAHVKIRWWQTMAGIYFSCPLVQRFDVSIGEDWFFLSIDISSKFYIRRIMQMRVSSHRRMNESCHTFGLVLSRIYEWAMSHFMIKNDFWKRTNTHRNKHVFHRFAKKVCEAGFLAL